MATVRGVVQNKRGDVIESASIAFFNRQTGGTQTVESKAGGGFEVTLAPGRYVWVAVERGYAPRSEELVVPGDTDAVDQLIALEQTAGETSEPLGSPPTNLTPFVKKLLDLLDKKEFSIDPPVSTYEAYQAVGLFAVVNLMLAGLGQYRHNGREQTDMFGMVRLNYGLQDKSLSQRIVAKDSKKLWQRIENDVIYLAGEVDRLQANIDFLQQEAKRQFNLGTNNAVLGSTQFPTLFKQYIELGADPRLEIDVRQTIDKPWFDDVKREEIYDLLRDLRDVVVKIARSLSRYGTPATRRVADDWAEFEWKALNVLQRVAEERVGKEVEEETAWFVMADTIEKDRDEFIPYIALGKHGSRLLEYAVDIYNQAREEELLETSDAKKLLDLFQTKRDGRDWWTRLIRPRAHIISRYPHPNWG